jgi:hypothetical protein
MKMLSSCKRSTASARRSTTLAISTFRTCRTGTPPVSQSNNTLGRSRWNSSRSSPQFENTNPIQVCFAESLLSDFYPRSSLFIRG